MLNCRQVTRLVSQSMDAKLPWHRGLAVRFHLLYCVWCRRYASQVQILRKAAKGFAIETQNATAEKLSPDAKEQMRKCVQEALKNPPS